MHQTTAAVSAKQRTAPYIANTRAASATDGALPRLPCDTTPKRAKPDATHAFVKVTTAGAHHVLPGREGGCAAWRSDVLIPGIVGADDVCINSKS